MRLATVRRHRDRGPAKLRAKLEVGGRGSGIELKPDFGASNTVWISTDGTNWQPLNLEFLDYLYGENGFGYLQVFGDFIFVIDASSHWIGEVNTG